MWPRTVILVVLLLASMAAAGQTRCAKIDLCGIWEILPDANDIGIEERWYEPGHKGAWQPIVVPSSWETVLGTEFDGIAWYRKQFHLSQGDSDRRVLLRFHGAATEARVWVNGKAAGSHTGPWTAFTLDVTRMVDMGEPTEVIVRLDEKVGHSTQGFLPIIAPHFGGLWQTVEVLLKKAAWLDDVRITMDATRINVAQGTGMLRVSVPISGQAPEGATLRFGLWQDAQVLGQHAVVSARDPIVQWLWQGKVNVWDVGKPNLYTVQIELLGSDSHVLDVVRRRVGFRRVTAKGPQILLNGQPLIVRGVLSWGYYPPLLAPAPDRALFRKQLQYFRACGFNLIKFCLWLPPQALLDVVDEEGMLSWIEYPTWHARIDQDHRDALIREYTELSHHDGDHPSAILRSITCETGPSADLDVLRDIYTLLKNRCPGTLVEDDSSWITWNRIHDFWDDHAYGNNRTWRTTLRSLQEYMHEHGVKPFLLGEAVFADTWADTGRLLSMCTDADPWWLPRWLDDQLAFESDLERRFTLPGFSPVKDLKTVADKYAMDMRRWQLETFRDQMPDSGYVVSTIRDMRLCNMGLIDNADRPKWEVEAWGFHGSLMTAVRTPGDQRAFLGTLGGTFRFTPSVRVTDAWNSADHGQITWRLGPAEASSVPSDGPPGLAPHADNRGVPLAFQLRDPVQKPTPLYLTREIPAAQPHQTEISWELWALPEPAKVPAGLVLYGNDPDRTLERLFPGAARLAEAQPIQASTPAVVTRALCASVMAYLDSGGHVLHLTSGLRGSWRTEDLWFGRGTAWAPPVPRAFFDRCPGEMLSYLQLFELGGTDVIRGESLWNQVDPLLSFLETHDLERVRPNLLLFQTRVGKGRLAVSCLRHEAVGRQNHAGLWLARELVQYLIQGPAPTRALSRDVREALRTGLVAEILKVEDTWLFRKDSKATGLEQAWFDTGLDESQWSPIMPRSAQEGEIWNRYDGWGWYRKSVEIPGHWKGRRIRLVFDSVDDMYELYVNGHRAGGHGHMDQSESSFLKRTWQDVGPLLAAGQTNQITVRLYDWTGSGGLNGEVWFTTGPVDPGLDLLCR